MRVKHLNESSDEVDENAETAFHAKRIFWHQYLVATTLEDDMDLTKFTDTMDLFYKREDETKENLIASIARDISENRDYADGTLLAATRQCQNAIALISDVEKKALAALEEKKAE